MLAFFDTSVHIALLRGDLVPDTILAQVEGGPVRMSPVVASELSRGARGRATRAVEELIKKLVPIEPQSWRQCWLVAGRIVRVVFPDHEDVGLARVQNDVLLALTARHTGATLVTYDDHFRALQKHVPFQLVMPSAGQIA